MPSGIFFPRFRSNEPQSPSKRQSSQARGRRRRMPGRRVGHEVPRGDRAFPERAPGRALGRAGNERRGNRPRTGRLVAVARPRAPAHPFRPCRSGRDRRADRQGQGSGPAGGGAGACAPGGVAGPADRGPGRTITLSLAERLALGRAARRGQAVAGQHAAHPGREAPPRRRTEYTPFSTGAGG